MKKFVKSSASAIIIVAFNALMLLLDYEFLNYIGIPLILFGAFCYFYNRHVMGQHWTITVEKKSGIVKEGFFKYIRHPLYLGAITACLGLVICTLNYWLLGAFLVVDLPYTYYRALLEEKLLAKHLKGYTEYMKTTWMFIPHIF